jgi:pimeloyl-ACP methyl ester carboxylesterase
MRRLALAGQIGAMTRQAVDQLGIPAQSTTMTVNGLYLHAVVAGPENGPLVVLLHGFPESWTAWRHSFRPLADAGYRVIAPDQRGYNLSDKPAGVHNYRLDAVAADVRELIRASGRETAIIVGHDLGGSVAWQTAMDYPDIVDKLIIMNSPHPAAFAREVRENPAQQQRSWYMLFFRLPWLPELMLGQSPLETANLFFRLGAVNQNAYSSYDLHLLAASMSQPGALTAMLNYYRAAFRYKPTGITRVIKTPTLIIWGEDDVALGKSLTYRIEQWVPNVKIHYVPNSGHWVQNEAADNVDAAMLAFLQPRS